MNTIVRRKHRHEAERAVKELEERGFEVTFPLTEFTRDGKNFSTDSYSRKIFQHNTFSSVWIAKLKKEEK